MMALLHLVAQLAAGWLAAFGHPAPAVPAVPPPVVVQVPAPPALDQPPVPPAPVSPVPPPVLAQPGPADLPPQDCRPGEEWQGEFGCVAVQLPAETDGRTYG